MTDYSRQARHRRAANEDRHPHRPWPQIVKMAVAGLLAGVPVWLELARALDENFSESWPVLAQIVVVLTIVSRVLASAGFERWAAQWAPWLTTRDVEAAGHDTPPGPSGLEDG